MRSRSDSLIRLAIEPVHYLGILNGRILRAKQSRQSADALSHSALIRCGIPHGAEYTTLHELSRLLPISGWVNLRTPEEAGFQFKGMDFPSTIHYIERPIRFKPPVNNLARRLQQSDYYPLYCSMSTIGWSAAEEVTELLRRGNVVLNCNLGKDRTGIVTAATLMQLGFSNADIKHDFALSARFLRREYQLIQSKANKNGVPYHLQACRYELTGQLIAPLLTEWAAKMLHS